MWSSDEFGVLNFQVWWGTDP